MGIPLAELDYIHIAESIGLAATCDLLVFLGMDEDLQVYQNEMHWKILKSRQGGEGYIGKFYVDDRSLKMYDSLELELWMKDQETSSGSRNLIE